MTLWASPIGDLYAGTKSVLAVETYSTVKAYCNWYVSDGAPTIMNPITYTDDVMKKLGEKLS